MIKAATAAGAAGRTAIDLVIEDGVYEEDSLLKSIRRMVSASWSAGSAGRRDPPDMVLELTP